MSDVLIEARGIDVAIGRHLVLRDLTFALRPGEFAVLTGPNGAGKTTLLKALAGLLPVQSGHVGPHARKPGEIAYLEQGGRIYWPMSVRDIVALGRLPFGAALQRLSPDDHEAIETALLDCGLSALSDRSASCLSGGEVARVLMARALAVRAPVLLVDEPIASLDPARQIATMQVLERQARRGGAVLAVLHDLPLALRFADRVVVMDGGRIAADAAPQEILASKTLDRVFGLEFQFEGVGRDLLLTPRIGSSTSAPGPGDRV